MYYITYIKWEKGGIIMLFKKNCECKKEKEHHSSPKHHSPKHHSSPKHRSPKHHSSPKHRSCRKKRP